MNMNKTAVAQEIVKIAKSLIADNMRFNVYGLYPGTLEFDDEARMISTLAIKGIHKIGVLSSHSVRQELQGKPRFDRLLGPMWDGPRGIRYETPDVYNALSE